MWNQKIKYPLKSQKGKVLAGLFFFFAFSFITIGIFQSLKPAQAKGTGSKVMTVFEQGKRTSFKTDAKTVAEALKEQEIEIAKEDNVEPALNEELTDTDYNVNIYRATPFVVVDNENRTKVMSSAKTPQKVAEDAGVKVFNEDIILAKNSENILEDGAAQILEIYRAKLITVNLFGTEKEFRTQAETIADFLTEKNITLTDKDGLSKELNHKIEGGDFFEIWRNGKQTITVDEEIDFEIEIIEDASKETSYRQIKEAGEKGQKTVVYEIDMQNGVEISRTKISETETSKPKKQVEVVGTKTNSPLYTGGGSKDEWLAASGIPQEYWGYVDAIVTKESGWNPNATNPTSGACGLAQALPCSKVGGNGGYDPVSALQWMNAYVNGRYYYGSPYVTDNRICSGKARGWECAWAFWQARGWY